MSKRSSEGKRSPMRAIRDCGNAVDNSHPLRNLAWAQPWPRPGIQRSLQHNWQNTGNPTLSSVSPHSIFVTLDCELYLCNRDFCSSNVMTKCHNQLREFCKKPRSFRKYVLKEMVKNCKNDQWLFYVALALSST